MLVINSAPKSSPFLTPCQLQSHSAYSSIKPHWEWYSWSLDHYCFLFLIRPIYITNCYYNHWSLLFLSSLYIIPELSPPPTTFTNHRINSICLPAFISALNTHQHLTTLYYFSRFSSFFDSPCSIYDSPPVSTFFVLYTRQTYSSCHQNHLQAQSKPRMTLVILHIKAIQHTLYSATIIARWCELPRSTPPLLAKMKRYVSSAYWWWCAPNDPVTFARGSIYKKKRNGSKEEPCSTLMLLPFIADWPKPHQMNEWGSFRYDRFQSNADSEHMLQSLDYNIVVDRVECYQHVQRNHHDRLAWVDGTADGICHLK